MHYILFLARLRKLRYFLLGSLFGLSLSFCVSSFITAPQSKYARAKFLPVALARVLNKVLAKLTVVTSKRPDTNNNNDDDEENKKNKRLALANSKFNMTTWEGEGVQNGGTGQIGRERTKLCG